MISGFRHTQRPPSKLLTVLFLRRRWRKFSPTTPIRTRRTATRLPARKLRRRAPPALRRFKKGINKFTDMSEAEINRYKGKRPVRPLTPSRLPSVTDTSQRTDHPSARRAPFCPQYIWPCDCEQAKVDSLLRFIEPPASFMANLKPVSEVQPPNPDTPSMVAHTAWSASRTPCSVLSATVC